MTIKILTDLEIEQLYAENQGMKEFARRVEASVLARADYHKAFVDAIALIREFRADGAMEDWGNDLPERIDAFLNVERSAI